MLDDETTWSDLPEADKEMFRKIAAKKSKQEPKEMTKLSGVKQLSEIIDQGKREVGYVDHQQSPDRVIRTQKPAATAGYISLLDSRMDAPLKRDNTRSLLAGTEAGVVIDLPAKIAEASRVCSFGGAKLIVAADPPAANPSGMVVFQEQAGAMVLVESAPFSQIDEEASLDAPTTALSAFIHAANIVWPDAPSHAFSCTVTRRDQKDHSYSVDEAVMNAIILGIGRLADSVLLSAIVTARTGSVFTLQAAALAGLKHGELRAIGSDLTSAILRTDGGQLYHGPVPVELSDTINGIVTGSFARAGVAIHPSLRVAVKRLNVDGSMELSCFCNMLPLIPNPAVFWVG